MGSRLPYTLPVSNRRSTAAMGLETDDGVAEGTGTGDWKGAYARARRLVGQMTFEEKVPHPTPPAEVKLTRRQVDLTTGTHLNNGCAGNIGPIPRLKFPGLCLTDGPAGVRSTNYVNSWPAQLSVGARYATTGLL